MRAKTAQDRVTLPEAARTLGVSWPVAYRLLLGGDLYGEIGVNGRWLISRRSLDSLARKRARAAATPTPEPRETTE